MAHLNGTEPYGDHSSSYKDDNERTVLMGTINTLRENPNLATLDYDVIRDKLMNLRVVRRWDRNLRVDRRDQKWHALIDSAYKLLERDRKRAAWHLRTADLSKFRKKDAAYAQLEAHAKAGLLLGMQSDVALSIIVNLTGVSKPECGRWRKKLFAAGLLGGDLGRPNNHPDGGKTARILFPCPVDTPYGFNPDPVLPELDEQTAAKIRLPMDESRQEKLESVPEEELSDKGKAALDRVIQATRSAGYVSSKSDNHRIQSNLEALSCGELGSVLSTEIEDMEPTLQPPEVADMHEIHASVETFYSWLEDPTSNEGHHDGA